MKLMVTGSIYILFFTSSLSPSTSYRRAASFSVVLGDMGEVGDNGTRFHAEIGEYARTRGIGHFFTFGNMARSAAEAYGKAARHFTEIDAMNHVLREMLAPEMTVLVKGSRFMKMERVVEQLMEKEGR